MSQFLKALGIRERRSFTNIASTPLAIKTNVLSGGSNAYTGGIIRIPNRTVASWLESMNQSKSYELFDLVQNILKLFTDYVYDQLDLQTKEYVEITDNPVLTQKVINLINETKYNDKFIQSISDVIYYGGKGYKIDVFEKTQGKRKILLHDLHESYSICSVFKVEKPEKHYDRFIPNRVVHNYDVFQDTSSVEVSESDLLFIGDHNFKLIDSRLIQEQDINKSNRKTDELLLDEFTVYASKPLLYSVLEDVRNYIVYKTLSSVLAVKDALIPSFMRLGVDLTKATSTDKINETVNEIESKINESIDTTLIMGQQLQIDQLINAVFSNVRVLPDPGNLLSSIDALNLDPLKEKLEEINSKLEETKNNLFESLGIPADLFDGGSNQYEVVTRNQRYQTTVSAFLSIFKKTYKDNVIKLFKLKYPNASKEDLNSLNNMTVRLFRISSIEIEKLKNVIEQNRELADSVDQLVSTFNNMIQNNPVIDKDKALELLKSTMNTLGDTYKNLIVKELPKETEESGRGGGW